MKPKIAIVVKSDISHLDKSEYEIVFQPKMRGAPRRKMRIVVWNFKSTHWLERFGWLDPDAVDDKDTLPHHFNFYGENGREISSLPQNIPCRDVRHAVEILGYIPTLGF